MARGVLLFGAPRAPHVAALAQELERRSVPVAHLDPRAYPARSWITQSIGPSADLRSFSEEVDLSTIGAGWIGGPRTIRLSGTLAPASRRFAKAAALQGLDSLLRACPFPWVNDPDAAARCDDKVLQLATARRLGLRVPDTLVTNDPAAFLRFQRRHPRLIAKTVAGSDGLPDSKRVLTNEVTSVDVAAADAVRHSPVCFQEAVPKKSELRVTVVGRRVHAVRIHSQASERTRVDWRRYGPALDYSRAELPGALERKCVALARTLGLDYGGIDLIERPDGRHVFLEINTLPAWLWLEDATGEPITASLARHLGSKAGRAAPRPGRRTDG
jgi:glutathione synthase/RimK-type ligase-like ATP-grasp enzyme